MLIKLVKIENNTNKSKINKFHFDFNKKRLLFNKTFQ